MSHINLLPTRVQGRLMLKLNLAQWAIAWAVCGTIMVAVCTLNFFDQQSLARHLDELEQRTAPIRIVSKDNQELSQQLAEFTKRESLLSELDDAENPLTLVGMVSQAAGRCRSGLQVRELSLKPWNDAGRRATKQSSSQEKGKPETEAIQSLMMLTVKGLAADDMAVAHFVRTLRSFGVFRSVELREAIVTELPSGLAREYLVECVY